jgi:hypothetical protein
MRRTSTLAVLRVDEISIVPASTVWSRTIPTLPWHIRL